MPFPHEMSRASAFGLAPRLSFGRATVITLMMNLAGIRCVMRASDFSSDIPLTFDSACNEEIS